MLEVPFMVRVYYRWTKQPIFGLLLLLSLPFSISLQETLVIRLVHRHSILIIVSHLSIDVC